MTSFARIPTQQAGTGGDGSATEEPVQPDKLKASLDGLAPERLYLATTALLPPRLAVVGGGRLWSAGVRRADRVLITVVRLHLRAFSPRSPPVCLLQTPGRRRPKSLCRLSATTQSSTPPPEDLRRDCPRRVIGLCRWRAAADKIVRRFLAVFGSGRLHGFLPEQLHHLDPDL
jgi:hypothetical protein